MRTTGFSRLVPAALLLVAGIWLGAASPAPGANPADAPAGQLLIASATIQDPRFNHTVILLLRHNDKGAFGLMINRPVEAASIAGLLADADKADHAGAGVIAADRTMKGTIRVFSGGPVQPQLGFIVHSPDYRRAGTLMLGHVVAMTASIDTLRDIGRGRGPKKYFFVLGYAGWGPGQLDAEIKRHDWFLTPADGELIFDSDRGELWQRALDRRTREL